MQSRIEVPSARYRNPKRCRSSVWSRLASSSAGPSVSTWHEARRSARAQITAMTQPVSGALGDEIHRGETPTTLTTVYVNRDRQGPATARQPRLVRPSSSCRPLVTSPPEHHHPRSEEHTSELQSLMRISYAVF